jgi:hypothetical protein
MKARHMELMAIMKAGQETTEAMTAACLEKAMTTGFVANPEEIESELEHEEVPKEMALVVIIRTLGVKTLCRSQLAPKRKKRLHTVYEPEM